MHCMLICCQCIHFYIISSSHGRFNFVSLSRLGKFYFYSFHFCFLSIFYIQICFSSIWQGAVIKIFLMHWCLNLPLHFKMVLCLCQWSHVSSSTGAAPRLEGGRSSMPITVLHPCLKLPSFFLFIEHALSTYVLGTL